MNDAIIERLQELMQDATDHEWWDAQAILEENKPQQQRAKDQIKELKAQAVAAPQGEKYINKDWNYGKTN